MAGTEESRRDTEFRDSWCPELPGTLGGGYTAEWGLADVLKAQGEQGLNSQGWALQGAAACGPRPNAPQGPYKPPSPQVQNNSEFSLG